MKDMGWTFTELCERMDGLDEQTHPYDRPLRLAAIMEQFPEKLAEREERLINNHQRRLDISRVAIRTGIPGDLVPILCALAVPGSKQYPYMRM